MTCIGSLHSDHVGSLLRPAALRAARDKLLGIHNAERKLVAYSNQELRVIEDECIREVVKLQEDCGLAVVTDGEFRRRSWFADVMLSFAGVRVIYNGKTPLTFINAAGEQLPFPAIEVYERIHWRESVNAKSFEFLKSVTSKVPKVSLPGPPMVHFLRDKDFTPNIYPDIEHFWNDLIAAYRKEISELARLGCRYIQIDECMLAFLCDPRYQRFTESRGENPQKLIETYCWAINQAIAERPADMVIALHSCRGNMNAYWGSEGGYEPIAVQIFNHIDANVYLLEYDTERAGTFAPLRHLPKGKKVFLGLVSTKERELEDKDFLKRRIDEASKIVDYSQLGLCPQCGFSTNVLGTAFSVDDERRKLELIVDVSRSIWS